MSITYRKLGPGDSGLYRNIRLESLKTHPDSFGASYEEEKSKPKLRFEEVIDVPQEGWFIIGAFDQEKLVGISGFIPFILDEFPEFERAGSLVQMYVRSSYAGRKIGLNLADAVIQEAFQYADIDHIVLGVRESNLPAIKVYHQAGFRVYPLEQNSGDSSHAGFLLMVLSRPPAG